MTGPREGTPMTEQALTRLAELQREYEVGQRRLQELVAQEVAIRETLLRISGAIQVLEELTGPSPAAEPAAGSPTSAEPAEDKPPVVTQLAPGAVLRVG
jgi:hypothetical protein